MLAAALCTAVEVGTVVCSSVQGSLGRHVPPKQWNRSHWRPAWLWTPSPWTSRISKTSLEDNIVDNDMVLRAFRAGIFRNGLYQVMDLTDIVRQHAMCAAGVSEMYRARISTEMPHHPPGYMDFMLTQTAVQSLKAACDGLGRLLNSVGMPPVRDWARVR